jgi:hypothetical protein
LAGCCPAPGTQATRATVTPSMRLEDSTLSSSAISRSAFRICGACFVYSSCRPFASAMSLMSETVLKGSLKSPRPPAKGHHAVSVSVIRRHSGPWLALWRAPTSSSLRGDSKQFCMSRNPPWNCGSTCTAWLRLSRATMLLATGRIEEEIVHHGDQIQYSRVELPRDRMVSQRRKLVVGMRLLLDAREQSI